MSQKPLPGLLQLSMSCLLLCAGHTAHAGRPLSTDDAGVADAGTCQLESWIERQDSEHIWVTSPACGLLPGLELGAEYVHPENREDIHAEAGLALKWVPESWQFNTPWGDLGLGLKLSSGHVKPRGDGWQTSESTVAVLASLAASDEVSVHVNTGVTRDRASHVKGTLLNVAAVWTPSASWLLFAETQASSHTDIFGKPVTSAGVRYWLMPDQLGLDLTSSHQSGSDTRWTFGVGWYGLFK
jgi:hypothetical protein